MLQKDIITPSSKEVLIEAGQTGFGVARSDSVHIFKKKFLNYVIAKSKRSY